MDNDDNDNKTITSSRLNLKSITDELWRTRVYLAAPMACGASSGLVVVVVVVGSQKLARRPSLVPLALHERASRNLIAIEFLAEEPQKQWVAAAELHKPPPLVSSLALSYARQTSVRSRS